MADLQYITLAGIEGHTPPFWPLLKWGEVLVEYDLVVMGVYYPVYQTIVCKEAHDGALRDTVREVVDVNKKQQRPQNCALGDTRRNSSPRGIHSVNSNSHFTVTEEGTNPVEYGPSDTTVRQLTQQPFMGDHIKRTREIQNTNVDLVLSIVRTHQVVDGKKELGLARSSSPKCVLQGSQRTMVLEVVKYMFTKDVLHHLWYNTGQGDRSIVSRVVYITFFKYRWNNGLSPFPRDCASL